MINERKTKVFVGLSGGVDSSVSAALLKEATPNNFEKLFGRPTPEGFNGYDVTGVFIKTWHPDFLPCTWKEERLDAMRVSAHLDIPFLTFDFEDEYRTAVGDYMIEEYKQGRTPNPDVMCNKEVKFGAFLKRALEMGADFVATGHYAQKESTDGVHRLLAGVDTGKDQSYFLWTLTQEKLAQILFPVGHLQKSEVRKFAEKYNLPTAQKKDSQGVCFLGALDIKDFLMNFIPAEKGKVLDTSGNEIGEHDGAVFYTVGQRHGFSTAKSSTEDAPYYILEKHLQQNTLVVGHQKISATSGRAKITLEKTNWISSNEPDFEKTYKARFRYRQPLQECKLEKRNDSIAVIFQTPQEASAVGQSLVLYDGDTCLGGGVIT